ncbi:MAG: hypothetical protein ACI9NC_005682 [Verrucomicrobiales bacterium]|jgi:hypothetical protein
MVRLSEIWQDDEPTQLRYPAEASYQFHPGLVGALVSDPSTFMLPDALPR